MSAADLNPELAKFNNSDLLIELGKGYNNDMQDALNHKHDNPIWNQIGKTAAVCAAVVVNHLYPYNEQITVLKEANKGMKEMGL
jgi:hypothetical protein